MKHFSLLGFFTIFLSSMILTQDLKKIKIEKDDPRILQWQQTIANHGLGIYESGGYIYAINRDYKVLRGDRNAFSITDYNGLPESKNFETYKNIVAQKIVENYKVHFMPFDYDINSVVDTILTTLKNNKSLQLATAYLKVYVNYHRTLQQQYDNSKVFPRIVVYPASGKNHAQEVLNILYATLKNFKGMDIRPRYNATVTSLIYIAQGGGDFKNSSDLEKYYEQPNKIYYNVKELPPNAPDTDHYLMHPETGKPLVSID